MKLAKKIIIIIGVLIVIGIIGTSYYIGDSVFRGSLQMTDNEGTSLDSVESWVERRENFSKKYVITSIKIDSSSGDHQIPADYIRKNGDTDKDTVIMVHGLGGNRLSVYGEAEVFLENGYNVIAYDQRSSGENEALYNTFGYLESNDLRDYVNYLRDILSDNKKIGVWGQSFGGATVGIYSGSDHANQNIDFAILDSPVSNMSYMISRELEEMNMGIPINYMMLLGNIFTKFHLGFSYEDANVCNHIVNTRVPVLLIHSKTDQITPYFMGEDIYNSVKHDNKYMFSVEDSEHVKISIDYPEEYEKNIIKFITAQ
ncbi:alpha/beta fold hydrolase [Halanaerobiaceae bacterium ANBcell28]